MEDDTTLSTAALRDFSAVYHRFGSIAPDRHDRDARPMSASPPIASELWHRSETTRSASCYLMHRSKQSSLFDHLVGDAALDFKEGTESSLLGFLRNFGGKNGRLPL